MTLCTLGIGTAFGESILNDSPRHATIVTSGYCELLRIEQKDFKIIWEVGKIYCFFYSEVIVMLELFLEMMSFITKDTMGNEKMKIK